ncbi:MAG: hypothetical protein QOJ79_2081 [Actinomycetota bacterium]|jgi:hypothetical protein|nr:hypothetical protein [Actinomycetota bacterium]
MTSRPRRTTTLVGPNRLVVGAATAGLVALASAGTALLVLTGTSSVTPLAAPAPPLPSATPLNHAPGVVVLPPGQIDRSTGHAARAARTGDRSVAVVVAPSPPPLALAFTDAPPPQLVAPVAQAPVLASVAPSDVDPTAALPGRHLAKGHAKHAAVGPSAKHHTKHAKHHGKRVGWSHSLHLGNR